MFTVGHPNNAYLRAAPANRIQTNVGLELFQADVRKNSEYLSLGYALLPYASGTSSALRSFLPAAKAMPPTTNNSNVAGSGTA